MPGYKQNLKHKLSILTALLETNNQKIDVEEVLDKNRNIGIQEDIKPKVDLLFIDEIKNIDFDQKYLIDSINKLRNNQSKIIFIKK